MVMREKKQGITKVPKLVRSRAAPDLLQGGANSEEITTSRAYLGEETTNVYPERTCDLDLLVASVGHPLHLTPRPGHLPCPPRGDERGSRLPKSSSSAAARALPLSPPSSLPVSTVKRRGGWSSQPPSARPACARQCGPWPRTTSPPARASRRRTRAAPSRAALCRAAPAARACSAA